MLTIAQLTMLLLPSAMLWQQHAGPYIIVPGGEILCGYLQCEGGTTNTYRIQGEEWWWHLQKCSEGHLCALKHYSAVSSYSSYGLNAHDYLAGASALSGKS